MKEKLEQRLKKLKEEFEAGQKQLAEMEERQTELRTTLLRISGAIQVLEEELLGDNGQPQNKPAKEEWMVADSK